MSGDPLKVSPVTVARNYDGRITKYFVAGGGMTCVCVCVCVCVCAFHNIFEPHVKQLLLLFLLT